MIISNILLDSAFVLSEELWMVLTATTEGQGKYHPPQSPVFRIIQKPDALIVFLFMQNNSLMTKS